METTNKMTIHRALSELKTLDARITKQIGSFFPTAFNQKDKKINNYLDVAEFEKNVKADYQSLNDLMTRKLAIKSAIVASNAVTKVKIGEKEYTVAEAITFRSILPLKKQFMESLDAKHKQILAAMNKNNEVVEKNVQVLLENTFGGKENLAKIDENNVNAVSKPYREINQFHLIDPLKIEDEIKKMDKEISDFALNVDAILSESNATTFIELK